MTRYELIENIKPIYRDMNLMNDLLLLMQTPEVMKVAERRIAGGCHKFADYEWEKHSPLKVRIHWAEERLRELEEDEAYALNAFYDNSQCRDLFNAYVGEGPSSAEIQRAEQRMGA